MTDPVRDAICTQIASICDKHGYFTYKINFAGITILGPEGYKQSLTGHYGDDHVCSVDINTNANMNIALHYAAKPVYQPRLGRNDIGRNNSRYFDYNDPHNFRAFMQAISDLLRIIANRIKSREQLVFSIASQIKAKRDRFEKAMSGKVKKL